MRDGTRIHAQRIIYFPTTGSFFTPNRKCKSIKSQPNDFKPPKSTAISELWETTIKLATAPTDTEVRCQSLVSADRSGEVRIFLPGTVGVVVCGQRATADQFVVAASNLSLCDFLRQVSRCVCSDVVCVCQETHCTRYEQVCMTKVNVSTAEVSKCANFVLAEQNSG